MELMKITLWCLLLIVGLIIGFTIDFCGLMSRAIHIQLQVACVVAPAGILFVGYTPGATISSYLFLPSILFSLFHLSQPFPNVWLSALFYSGPCSNFVI